MTKVTIEEINEAWAKAISERCRNTRAIIYLTKKQSEQDMKIGKDTLWYMLLLVIMYIGIAPILLYYELYVGIVIFTMLIIGIKGYLDIRLDNQIKMLKEKRYEYTK